MVMDSTSNPASTTAAGTAGEAAPRGGRRLSEYGRNVLTLMSGTVAAKVITLAAAPVLARLFDPAAYGTFGVFASLVAVATVVGSLGYQRAVVLPKSDHQAAGVFRLSVLLLGIVTAVAGVLMLLLHERVAAWTNSPGLAPLLIWLPVALLVTGCYELFEFWATRRKQFRDLSRAHMRRSAGTVGAQLACGAMGMGPGGLVGGYVVGHAFGAGWFGRQLLRADEGHLKRRRRWRRLGVSARRHSDFPRYTLPANIVGRSRNALIPILLSVFFTPVVVGLYWFTYRLVAMANVTVGRSVRQVFFQRASELRHREQSVSGLLLKNVAVLALVGAGPAMLVVAAGPWLFETVFGEAWREAGAYARWMGLFGLAQFVHAPALELLFVFKLQKWHLLLEVLLIGGQGTGVAIGAAMGDPLLAIMLSSLIAAALLLAQIVVMSWYVRHHEAAALARLSRGGDA